MAAKKSNKEQDSKDVQKQSEELQLTPKQVEVFKSEEFQKYLADEMEARAEEMSTMAGAGQYLRWAKLAVELLFKFLEENGFLKEE